MQMPAQIKEVRMSVQTTARTASARKLLAGGIVLLLAVALAATTLRPGSGEASSHREAPLTSADPQIDNTDFYAFRSPDAPNTVTLISNWIPFEEPAGGPNFYHFAEGTRYDLKIDNDGDAKPDVIYRYTFDTHYANKDSFIFNNGPVTSLGDENLLIYQTYDLHRIKAGNDPVRLINNKRVVPSNVGETSMPDYGSLWDAGIKTFADGSSMSFAGQADDPFFLDLRVFDLLYGGDFMEAGDDTLAGFNVNTIALQIPRSRLAKGSDVSENPVVGMWATASRRSTRVNTDNGKLKDKGPWVQVSRLGNPLVNEVVIPVGQKDRWNASKPIDDGQFASYVVEPELPELVEAVYPSVPAPDTCGNADPPRCRDDLVDVFLKGLAGLNKPPGVTPSEQLRLNLTTPVCSSGCSTLGVIDGDTQGFPNGRRLDDDVVDIALQVVEGELVGNPNTLSDAVQENDVEFGSSFPYLGMPWAGSDETVHEGP
jgi:Domain of unknown function (DUF4331)